MTTEIPTATPAGADTVAAILTYVPTDPGDGEEEAGAVLLDDREIGRLSRRARIVARDPRSSFTAPAPVWHADAVGWLPDATRPWDTRITRSAPTRRRAAEDLVRAYRNR
jgi:hypothetical protein